MAYHKPILHVPPELHQRLKIQALVEGKSLTQLVQEILNEELLTRQNPSVVKTVREAQK